MDLSFIRIPKLKTLLARSVGRLESKEFVRSESGASVSGDGGYRFEVVGESQYQADLEHIVGGRTEDSVRCQCVGVLTPEPSNPYDPQAVYVSVDGRKVAYLSRDWAAKFNAALASSGYAQASCNALIVGGWDRGKDDRGHFGIKLDIALPLELQPTPLTKPRKDKLMARSE